MCATCRTPQDVTATERGRDGWDGWRTETLACGHALQLTTTYCKRCKGQQAIMETTTEPGHPDPHGDCQMFRVEHLECGHGKVRQLYGVTTSVL